MLNIILIIFLLSFVVFFHELGHLLFAKYFNVKVKSFSIGMGPVLFSKKDKSGVLWKICALPLGGSVEPYHSLDEEKIELKNGEKAFDDASGLERMLIAFAGPLFNFILSFFGFLFIFSFVGIPFSSKEVSQVELKSVAMQVGISKGDIIISVNGKKDYNNQDFHSEELILKIFQQNKEEKTFNVKKEKGVPFGIAFKKKFEKHGFLKNIKTSYLLIKDSVFGLFKVLKSALTERKKIQFMGPIGIFAEAKNMAKESLWLLIYFVLFFSVSVGAANLIPIPALDGGHILLGLISLIIRRKISQKIENYLNYISMVILFLVFFYSFFSDIRRFK